MSEEEFSLSWKCSKPLEKDIAERVIYEIIVLKLRKKMRVEEENIE